MLCSLCERLHNMGNRSSMQAMEPASMKNQRRDVVIGVQVVHTKHDDVVIAGADARVDAAFQPGACSTKEYGAGWGCPPIQLREAVAVAC